MMHATVDYPMEPRDPLWVRVLSPALSALWLIWAAFVLAILWLIDRFDDARQRRRSAL